MNRVIRTALDQAGSGFGYERMAQGSSMHPKNRSGRQVPRMVGDLGDEGSDVWLAVGRPIRVHPARENTLKS
jgi:hypothetical protein